MMQLTYLYHSGFVLTAPGVTLVLDYFEDTETATDGLLHREFLHRPGRLYVLASHFHADHFNPEVLEWRQQRPDIVYLLSADIRRRRAQARRTPGIVWLKKGDTYDDGTLRVRAFGSTDVGVSFCLELQGRTVFHAGDLNNWHWSEESTPQEIRKAEGDFLAEVRELQQTAPAVDVAMFPVDSRIGKDYMRGAEQFVERIKITIFVPMHFSEDYQGGNAFRQFAESKGCRFLSIAHRGESFELPNL